MAKKRSEHYPYSWNIFSVFVYIIYLLTNPFGFKAKNFWSRVEGDVLPYAPCEMLLKEARASILFASDQFSSISETLQPDELLQVHFGRVDRFKGSEDRIICNPEVVNFYTAASMSEGLLYIAALGVIDL